MSYNRHEILGYIQCFFPLYSFQKVSNAYENTSETSFFLNRCFLYTNKSSVSSYKVKKKNVLIPNYIQLSVSCPEMGCGSHESGQKTWDLFIQDEVVSGFTFLSLFNLRL